MSSVVRACVLALSGATVAAACGGAAFSAAVAPPSVDASVDAPSTADAIAPDADVDGWVQPICDGGQNLQSDPANCGLCGHDCAGGACEAGACQPVQLAVGQRVTGVALVGAELYYMEQDTGQMRHMTLPGGTAQAVSSPVQAGGGYFTIPPGASYALVRTLSQIVRVPLAGGAPVQVLGGLPTGFGVTSDGNVMYWVENASGQMRRASVDGGGVGSLGDGGLSKPEQMVLVQNAVGVADLGNGRVVYVDRDAGTLNVYRSGLDQPAGIAVDGNSVFVTAQGAGTVLVVNGVGGPITTLASTQMPTGIAVNGRWIVWGSAGAGGVTLLAR